MKKTFGMAILLLLLASGPVLAEQAVTREEVDALDRKSVV